MKCWKAVLLLILFSAPWARGENLIYHEIRVDSKNQILPWLSDDLGVSYDDVIHRVWNYWIDMETEANGLPYYMNHQVWRPGGDLRGIGGDQVAMALSSWRMLYAYTGDESVRKNMIFIADYYLKNSLSKSTDQWPLLPYPYNTDLYSGKYDGDMIDGKEFLQPDKAGSFALELLQLSKFVTSQSKSQKYLSAAKQIAKVLISKIRPGTRTSSPFPFKVNARTGEVGTLRDRDDLNVPIGLADYTTNWAPTMQLLLELQMLDPRNEKYTQAFQILLNWMQAVPMQTNKWGPFFEDIPDWSETQINAMTFARFIMEHPQFFPHWKFDVEKILNWIYATLGNENWKQYGVTVINEQTRYLIAGQSHTARQAADELLFGQLTGDHTRDAHAVRQLNWATYMVDFDGKNRFPEDDVWLTDGYGDYVRHYLRAMAVRPELAPQNENHLLATSSVVQKIKYGARKIQYRSFDLGGTETFHLSAKPAQVISPTKGQIGFEWRAEGTLTIRRTRSSDVEILF